MILTLLIQLIIRFFSYSPSSSVQASRYVSKSADQKNFQKTLLPLRAPYYLYLVTLAVRLVLSSLLQKRYDRWDPVTAYFRRLFGHPLAGLCLAGFLGFTLAVDYLVAVWPTASVAAILGDLLVRNRGKRKMIKNEKQNSKFINSFFYFNEKPLIF